MGWRVKLRAHYKTLEMAASTPPQRGSRKPITVVMIDAPNAERWPISTKRSRESRKEVLQADYLMQVKSKTKAGTKFANYTKGVCRSELAFLHPRLV